MHGQVVADRVDEISTVKGMEKLKLDMAYKVEMEKLQNKFESLSQDLED